MITWRARRAVDHLHAPHQRGSPRRRGEPDPLSDIAVLRSCLVKPRAFPVASWGDATKLKVGDRVLALGSPLALSQSVTMGIVSNTEMIMLGLFLACSIG